MRRPRANVGHVLLSLFLLLSSISTATGAERTNPGTLMLVGDVLSYQQRALWKRIFELAGGEDAGMVVIAAAHERAKLYGDYALRASSRYGAFLELLPLAVPRSEFGTDYHQVVRDPDLVEKVLQSDAVFFVGGAPQRLSRVMFSRDGSATPLAVAIRQVYESGGVIVGGIPGRVGAHTGLEAMSVLERARLPEEKLYRGLSLIDDGWYVDQHFFSPGRFAETLVAMHQLGTNYGIGVGAGAAAVIRNGQLEVVGEGGVVIIDLSAAGTAANEAGFNLNNIRLTYLDNGDHADLSTLRITPQSRKLEGFEIDPNAGDHQPWIGHRDISTAMFDHGRLLDLMLAALDSGRKQAIGLAFRDQANQQAKGFRFRFYVGDDSRGWLSTRSGRERYTAQNIYLDITPLAGKEIKYPVR